MEQPLVVAAILQRRDEVLLCHRSANRRWYPSIWDLPGGHVEHGEQPREALRRELLEEVGVDIGTVRSDPVLCLRRPETGLDLTVWLVTRWNGTVENRQAEEHDEIAWFRVEELAGLDFADDSYLPLIQGLLATG